MTEEQAIDVIKESEADLSAGLSWKQVAKPVNAAARTLFNEKLEA